MTHSSPISNEAIALSFETKLNLILENISDLRRQIAQVDMRDQIGNEPWFSQAGHPLLESKELAYRAVQQIGNLAPDIKYVIENGSI